MAGTDQQCRYKYDSGKRCSNDSLESYNFCEQHAYELGIPDIFKTVSEHFRQDLREFWTRANMYIVSQAFLFSAFAVLISNFSQASKVHGHDFLIITMLAAVGLFLAVCWFFVAKNSRDWIQRWKNSILELDEIFNTHNTFVKTETEDKPKGDLTKWTMYLPVGFAVAWTVLLVAGTLAFFGWWM